MHRCLSSLAVSVLLAATVGLAAPQANQPKSVTASVVVTTSDSRRNIAVLSKDEPQFLFCIDLAAPLPQTITFTGTARVVYRPLPPLPSVPGVKVDVMEHVTSVLAVLPSEGKGWLFLAKNEAAVLTAAEVKAAGVTTVPATVVRRVDWVPAGGGARRGLDVEACFETGG